MGRSSGVTPAPGGVRLVVDAGGLDLDDVAVGDSIAVNGVCLTVVELRRGRVRGRRVARNAGLHRGLCATGQRSIWKRRCAWRTGWAGTWSAAMSTASGTVVALRAVGDNRLLAIAAPRELAKYIARKGSVAVNGVSLTVNEVNDVEFRVNLIPHTLQATNLRQLKTGDRVNLEVDLLARYAERLRQFDGGI